MKTYVASVSGDGLHLPGCRADLDHDLRVGHLSRVPAGVRVRRARGVPRGRHGHECRGQHRRRLLRHGVHGKAEDEAGGFFACSCEIAIAGSFPIWKRTYFSFKVQSDETLSNFY